jgi:hypothetical protein
MCAGGQNPRSDGVCLDLFVSFCVKDKKKNEKNKPCLPVTEDSFGAGRHITTENTKKTPETKGVLRNSRGLPVPL